MKIKVLNKNKEFVTFKVLGLPKNEIKNFPPIIVVWEEFNKTFEHIEGFIYRSKPEVDKIIREKNEFFTKVLPTIMMNRVSDGKNLTNLSMLGHHYEEYRKKFGGSMMDFVEQYKVFEQAIIENMMSSGIGVGSIHTKNHNFDEKNWSRDKRQKIRKTLDPENKNNTMSIGDILKGKISQ